jgi:hypothetical protein
MNTASLKRVALAGLLALAIGTGTACAWDGTGHMIIARIARERLTDKARMRVDALAARLQRNGVPYNGVNIACWADDIRTTDAAVAFHGQFKPWHFINIGCSSADPDVLGRPPLLTPTRGNLIVALAHCVNLIRHHRTDALVPDEAVALALVMHLVGDIHQPLHCATRYYPPGTQPGRFRDDGGGEDVPVANLAQTARPNLHTFWDEAYRRYAESGEVIADPPINEADPPDSPALESWLARLKPGAPLDPDLRFNPTQWALETHALGCAQAYGTLDKPGDNGNVTLHSAYVTEATRTARRQIMLAGYRLAALLNDLYGQ